MLHIFNLNGIEVLHVISKWEWLIPHVTFMLFFISVQKYNYKFSVWNATHALLTFNRISGCGKWYNITQFSQTYSIIKFIIWSIETYHIYNIVCPAFTYGQRWGNAENNGKSRVISMNGSTYQWQNQYLIKKVTNMPLTLYQKTLSINSLIFNTIIHSRWQ